jgi:hypothetical protein
MANLDASIAKRFDITVKQGQSFDAVLTFLDDDAQPISLAGGTAKMSVRQTASPNDDCGCIGDTPFDAIYKQDFSPTVTGINNNQLAFDDTILLSPGRYKYDLVVEFLTGYTLYFLYGTFKVLKSYTKI